MAMATDESFEREHVCADAVKAVLASSSSSSSSPFNGHEQDDDEVLDYNEAFPQLISATGSLDHYQGFSSSNPTEFDGNYFSSINANGSSHSNKIAEDDLRRRLAVHEKLATTKIIEIPAEDRLPEKSQRYTNNNSSNRGTAASSNNSAHLQKICAKIQKETSSNVGFLHKDQILIITITGRPEQVRAAQVRIVNKLQRRIEQNVEIPSNFHRYILGPQGATLRQLEQETLTRIAVPNQERRSNTIIVNGAKDNVKLAEQKLKSIYQNQFNKGYERLSIPCLYHPWIRHQLMDEMRRQLNVTIHLPPISKQIDEIAIQGERQPVEQARNLILQFYQSLQGKIMEFPLEIPSNQHRFILGKKGAGLKEIFDKTNAVVRIPNQEENSSRITIIGEVNKIGEAITMIYKMASALTSVKISSPHWMHSVVKGERGRNVELIRQKYPDVRIYFRDDFIDIEGPPEQVEPVQSQIQTVIDDLRNSNTTYHEVEIDPQFYKQLIGKNQIHLTEVQDQTGCDIKFPGENSRNVKLMGNKESVEKARQILLERVKKLSNERTTTISIDPQFYPQIIGFRGKKLDELREKFHQIQIRFPSNEEKSDKVTLHGDKEDVEKCTKFLQQKVKDWFSTEIEVARRIYPLFIGKSGSNIQRLREQFSDVRLEVPTLEENQEKFSIRLSGKKIDVEKSRKIVEEHIGELAESVENTVERTIKIDSKWHVRFLQSNRKLLIEIQKKFGDFNMKIPERKQKVDEIVIRGARNVIENVEKYIETLIDQWENSTTAEIEIPSRHHGYLLAQSAVYIKKLESEFDVRIKFPTKDKENLSTKDEIVKITGRIGNVEKAREALEKMVPIETTVEIPNFFHGNLVGRGGKQLQNLIDLYPDVQITFPSIKSQSNTIHFRGQKDQVEGFQRELVERYEKLIADREARSFELRLTIKSIFRPLIIGFRRRKLNQLKDLFQVQIVVVEHPAAPLAVVPTPSQQNKDDEQNSTKIDDQQAIPHDQDEEQKSTNENSTNNLNQLDFDLIIRGYEKQTIECRDEILRLIEEFQSKITMEIQIDPRVHSRIIGYRRENLLNLNKRFDVQIKFPNSKDSDRVYVEGSNQDNIDECIENLLSLEEDFLLDLPTTQKNHFKFFDENSSNKSQQQQQVPSSNQNDGTKTNRNQKQNSFKVKNAPWASIENVEENQDLKTKQNNIFHSPPNPTDLGEFPSMINGSSLNSEKNRIQTKNPIPVRWGPTKSNKQ